MQASNTNIEPIENERLLKSVVVSIILDSVIKVIDIHNLFPMPSLNTISATIFKKEQLRKWCTHPKQCCCNYRLCDRHICLDVCIHVLTSTELYF
jgi:hypothetical protein